jgi:hypothetical protein
MQHADRDPPSLHRRRQRVAGRQHTEGIADESLRASLLCADAIDAMASADAGPMGQSAA